MASNQVNIGFALFILVSVFTAQLGWGHRASPKSYEKSDLETDSAEDAAEDVVEDVEPSQSTRVVDMIEVRADKAASLLQTKGKTPEATVDPAAEAKDIAKLKEEFLQTNEPKCAFAQVKFVIPKGYSFSLIGENEQQYTAEVEGDGFTAIYDVFEEGTGAAKEGEEASRHVLNCEATQEQMSEHADWALKKTMGLYVEQAPLNSGGPCNFVCDFDYKDYKKKLAEWDKEAAENQAAGNDRATIKPKYQWVLQDTISEEGESQCICAAKKATGATDASMSVGADGSPTAVQKGVVSDQGSRVVAEDEANTANLANGGEDASNTGGEGSGGDEVSSM